jgi:hypothetical protein
MGHEREPGLCGMVEVCGLGVFGISALTLVDVTGFDVFLDRWHELVVLPRPAVPRQSLTLETWHPKVADWLDDMRGREVDVVLPGFGVGGVMRIDSVRAVYRDCVDCRSRWEASALYRWHVCASTDCRAGYPGVATRGMLCADCTFDPLERLHAQPWRGPVGPPTGLMPDDVDDDERDLGGEA